MHVPMSRWSLDAAFAAPLPESHAKTIDQSVPSANMSRASREPEWIKPSKAFQGSDTL